MLTSGQRGCGWGILVLLAELRCFIGTWQEDPVPHRQAQRIIDLVKDGEATPQVRTAIFLGGDRLQGVAIRDQVRASGVDRPGGGILSAQIVRELLEADADGGAQGIAGAAEHRVLGVDLLEVEGPGRHRDIAAPDETKRRWLMLLATEGQAAGRAPLEEQLDLLGDVANGVFPISETNLETDGSWLASRVFGLASGFGVHASRRRVPAGGLRDGDLAWIELEFEAAGSADFFEAGLDHLDVRHARCSSCQEPVMGQFQRLGCDLVVPDIEGGPVPLHRIDAIEIPGGNRSALRVERGDLRGLALDLELQAGDPIGHFLRVLVEWTGELDVLVLGAPGNAVDVGVLATLLVLEDLVLHGQAVALGPIAQVGAAVELDSETQALAGRVIRHRFPPQRRSVRKPARSRSTSSSDLSRVRIFS